MNISTTFDNSSIVKFMFKFELPCPGKSIAVTQYSLINELIISSKEVELPIKPCINKTSGFFYLHNSQRKFFDY